MKHPSASNAEAFLRCGVSHLLPQHDAYGSYTEDGTAGHGLIQDVIEKVPGAGAALEKAWPGLTLQIATIMHGVEKVRSEPAFVVNLKTRLSHFLGCGIGRKYEEALGRPLGKYEMPVSLDADGLRDEKVWLRDWKFGRYSSRLQLEIQAMAVLWSDVPAGPDLTEVDAGFVYVEGRDGGDVSVFEESEPIYVMDLDARADALCAAWDRVAIMENEFKQGAPIEYARTTEGSWCQYCGAYPNCPTKWKLARSMLELDVVASIQQLTVEQCGVVWEKADEAEKNIIKKTKDALKHRLRVEGSFPLTNGKKLRMIQMPGRESLDRVQTMALLLSLGATQNQINALFKEGEPYDQVRKTVK